jgi:hypothetical protein
MEHKDGVTSSVEAEDEAPRQEPQDGPPSQEPQDGLPSQEPDLEAPLLPAEAAGSPPIVHDAPPSAQKDTLLYICAVLSIVTAVGALLCLVVNLISLLRSFDYRGFDYRVSVFVGIIRFYAVAFALLVVIAETEWAPIVRFWKVLDYWVGRGLLQILVAALTKVLARASGETKAESLLHEVASWWLLACGILYIVSGLFCLGAIKRSHMQKANWKEQAQKELEEVHRRRQELEAQLGGHR